MARHSTPVCLVSNCFDKLFHLTVYILNHLFKSCACLYRTLEIEADCENWGWFWRISEKNLHVFRYNSKSSLWIYINTSLLERNSAPPSRVKFMCLAEVIFGVYGSIYHFSKPVHISTVLCEKIFIFPSIIVSIST